MDNPFWHIPEGPGPHCQVCGGSWPDGHYTNCPIVTGEAVQGIIMPAGYRQNPEVRAWTPTEFVGGPLDGHQPVVAPEQNIRLNVEGDTSGYYDLWPGDFKYHWTAAKAPSSDPSPKEVQSTRASLWKRLQRFWRDN
jgi:hypothetical protein